MILVLTMAGRYQRFLDAGHKLPKYLLPWGDKTVLSAILAELQKANTFDEVFLIANHRDEAYMPHVRAIMRTANIPPAHLVMTHDTKGQATTAMLGVQAIETTSKRPSAPVVFHNIDTVVLDRDTNQIARALSTYDGYIDVFSSQNAAYSYVLVDENRRVIEIAEKIVVSDLATSGLYGFRSAATYRDSYNEDDMYISAVYKRMISRGASILASATHPERDTIVLGTPLEYMNAALVSL